MNKAFQALADPTRRTILKKLNKGEMTAGQIADLIQSEKRGQFVVYTLNTTVIGDVLGWFYEFTHRI